MLDDGVVHGLVDLQGRAERHGMYPMSTVVRATDVRGRSFELMGGAMNVAPWAPCPAMVYVQCLIRWNHAGVIGYGLHQDVLSRAYLTRHRDAMRNL